MNIVLVKHKTAQEFAFCVPDELAPYIKKGQGVLCQTMRGLDYGITTTGVFSGDGALDIAFKNGAYLPLKPIVGFEHELMRNVVIDECVERLSKKYRLPQKQLPLSQKQLPF